MGGVPRVAAPLAQTDHIGRAGRAPAPARAAPARAPAEAARGRSGGGRRRRRQLAGRGGKGGGCGEVHVSGGEFRGTTHTRARSGAAGRGWLLRRRRRGERRRARGARAGGEGLHVAPGPQGLRGGAAEPRGPARSPRGPRRGCGVPLPARREVWWGARRREGVGKEGGERTAAPGVDRCAARGGGPRASAPACAAAAARRAAAAAARSKNTCGKSCPGRPPPHHRPLCCLRARWRGRSAGGAREERGASEREYGAGGRDVKSSQYRLRCALLSGAKPPRPHDECSGAV